MRRFELIVGGLIGAFVFGGGLAMMEAQPDRGGPTDSAAPPAAQAGVTREVHVLRIEFVRRSDADGVEVLVDGEEVSGASGQLLLRLVRRLRGGDAELDLSGQANASPDRGDRALPFEDDGDRGLARRGDGIRRGTDSERDSTRRRWPARPNQLDADDIDGMMEVIADLEPTLHGQLVDLQAQAPEVFTDKLREHWIMWWRFVELKRTDPERYRLEVARRRVSRSLFQKQFEYDQARRDGDTAEAERLRDEVRTLVTTQFEIDQSRRELELRRLETQLEALRARLEDWVERRDAMIDERVSRLLDATGFDFGDADEESDLDPRRRDGRR
ncbi:MAG: hypothetical protein ACF8PN_00240 [Phycisphaerales bacterium]